MQHIKHAVISAAGLGSRLGLNIPKCMIEIGGKKLIDYQLDLLINIPDVRIVVGFKELDIIKHVINIRNDITFIRNPNYASTSNAYSLHLATKHLKEPFVIIDGDLLINKISFYNFIQNCKNKSLIGITKSKTEEAVFVDLLKNNEIKSFQINKAKYEWSGIAYLKDINISKDGNYVFEQFIQHLPLKSHEIECYEIDTPKDLEQAVKNFHNIME